MNVMSKLWAAASLVIVGSALVAGSHDPHAVYLGDEQGLHPIALNEHATRDEMVRAPTVGAVTGTCAVPHSLRNAISGSTRNVRRAGIYAATIAIRASMSAAAVKVAGSSALTA